MSVHPYKEAESPSESHRPIQSAAYTPRSNVDESLHDFPPHRITSFCAGESWETETSLAREAFWCNLSLSQSCRLLKDSLAWPKEHLKHLITDPPSASPSWTQFTNSRRTPGKSFSHSRRETVVARANLNAESWLKSLDGFSRAALVAGAIAASCSLLPYSATAVSGGGGQCDELNLHSSQRFYANGRIQLQIALSLQALAHLCLAKTLEGRIYTIRSSTRQTCGPQISKRRI